MDTEKKPDNPPAFPTKSIDFQASAIQGSTVYDNYDEGMTLRDYFAAKAMQSIITGAFGRESFSVARSAYEYADSMLKEREKQ